MKAIRHGDVILVQVDDFDPSSTWREPEFQEETDVTLAEGEITGHSHVLTVNYSDEPMLVSEDVSASFGKAWFLDIPDCGATLTHEEHSTAPIEGGKWIAYQQREAWSDTRSRSGWNTRQVYD